MLNKKEIIFLLPIIIILLVFTFFADPTKGPILPCYINRVTGLYCPGCGMTRAIHSILRFDFAQAIRFNALSLIIPALYILYYISRRKDLEKISKFILILMFIISLAYGVLRNIEGFKFLGPTVIN